MTRGNLISPEVYLDSVEYCEELCIENISCWRYTFFLNFCFLFDSYEDENTFPGATTGVCHSTFEPTRVPTMLPTVVPTFMPTMQPTEVPTKFPSYSSPTESPSVSPSQNPTTTEPSNVPSKVCVFD